MSKQPLEHHSPLHLYDVSDNCLVVGKQKFTEILKSQPDVPAYLYDRTVIKQKIDTLRKYLPANMHIHYAIKAKKVNWPLKHIKNKKKSLNVQRINSSNFLT